MRWPRTSRWHGRRLGLGTTLWPPTWAPRRETVTFPANSAAGADPDHHHRCRRRQAVGGGGGRSRSPWARSRRTGRTGCRWLRPAPRPPSPRATRSPSRSAAPTPSRRAPRPTYTVSLSPFGRDAHLRLDGGLRHVGRHGDCRQPTTRRRVGRSLSRRPALGSRPSPSTTLQDVLDDDDETFTVTLSNATRAAAALLPPSPPTPSPPPSPTTTGRRRGLPCRWSPTSIGEADGETDVTVTATLEGSSTLTTATTVTLSLSGTASDPGDYAVTTALG